MEIAPRLGQGTESQHNDYRWVIAKDNPCEHKTTEWEREICHERDDRARQREERERERERRDRERREGENKEITNERTNKRKKERKRTSEFDTKWFGNCWFGNCRKQGTTGGISGISFAGSVNVQSQVIAFGGGALSLYMVLCASVTTKRTPAILK